MLTQTLFAFWKYDSFPYCLWGEVLSFSSTGKVTTREYGNGSVFKPFLILPEGPAKILISELEAIKGRQKIAVDSVYKEYNDLLKQIITVPWT